MKSFKKTRNVLFTALTLSLGSMLGGCGGDDPAAPTFEPATYTVPSTNPRLPGPGTLTSQYADSPTGSGLRSMIDGNNNSNFVTGHNNFYIVYEASGTHAVTTYSITSAADAPEKDPAAWSVYGSNDNSRWTLLDKQTGQSFAARKSKKDFELTNTTAFKYVKLHVEANGGGSSVQIAEFSLHAVKYSIDDLMPHASGRSDSQRTPMGIHFENRPATTDGDKAWFADASNEPLPSNAGVSQLKAFTVNLYPSAGKMPIPADANQHGVGDCCAIAVFASLAYIYPDFIKSIITDNGNQTYTVAMFDPQGKPVDVTVSNKFPADGNGGLQAVTGKNNVPCWSTVLEKALLKWQHIYKVNENIGGIGTEHVAPLFTGSGSSFAFGRGVLDNADLKRAVKVSLMQGKLVIGGFHPGDVPIAGTGSKTVTAHAYTFMHSAKSSALFVMRNPWGGNPDVDGSADGLLDIPDDGNVPKLIDLRILEPGKEGNFGSGVTAPYTPPTLLGASARMRVSPELLSSGR